MTSRNTTRMVLPMTSGNKTVTPLLMTSGNKTVRPTLTREEAIDDSRQDDLMEGSTVVDVDAADDDEVVSRRCPRKR
eukprot:4651076-Amphidinium_carterae.1